MPNRPVPECPAVVASGRTTPFDRSFPPRLRALLNRSSVAPKTLVSPGPSQEELELLVSAALTAPDHVGLRPFRFISIEGAGREQLSRTYMAIKKARDPRTRPEELARTWKKTMRAPCLLAVVARLDWAHPKVPAHEQYITVGGAVLAVLLACQMLGYGGIMLSGSRSRHRLVRNLLEIAPAEEVVGFISIGTPSKPIPPKVRPPPRDFLKTWRGNE